MANNTPLLDTSAPGWSVVFLGEHYRFANHERSLVTSGFTTRSALMRYAGSFLATKDALSRCRTRYFEYFPSTGGVLDE
jgi:hypothetical protein